MKRFLLLTGAVVLLTACTAAPEGTADEVDVAVVESVTAEGVVKWQDGEIVKAESNNTMAVAKKGAESRTAKLTADAALFAPLQCGTYEGVTLDMEGLGALKCTRDEYLAMTSHYGSKIYLNERGEIIKMADRYHP